MNLFVPEKLNAFALERGEEGAVWLASLPTRVKELEGRWRVHTQPALDHSGAVSWIAPAMMRDGSTAILKIGYPDEESRFESDALRFLDGQPTVRILESSEDGQAMLLERCSPGVDLWTLEIEDADTVAAHLLPKFWQDVPRDAPFVRLDDFVQGWWEDLPARAADQGYDLQLLSEVAEVGRDLVATQPTQVLLHGDFHPANVLSAQRAPWLVIDPKPLVGDPAYDLASWMLNRYGAAAVTSDPVSELRGQIQRHAQSLVLDARRIAGWTAAKAYGWDWEPEVFQVFVEVFRGF